MVYNHRFHFYSLFFPPKLITIWAYPVFSWCFSNNPNSFPSFFDAVSFILISSSYFFFIFSILFFPGPCPWKIADRYLNAYFGFMSLPFAFRYYNFMRSSGLLKFPYLSLVRPNYSYFPNILCSLRYLRVSAIPIPKDLSYRKLTSSFIFKSSYSVNSLKD